VDVTLQGLETPSSRHPIYNSLMEKKMFWTIWTVLGLLADIALPWKWSLGATLPLGYLSWWIAYRSGWF
jgi:hypothetical protein